MKMTPKELQITYFQRSLRNNLRSFLGIKRCPDLNSPIPQKSFDLSYKIPFLLQVVLCGIYLLIPFFLRLLNPILNLKGSKDTSQEVKCIKDFQRFSGSEIGLGFPDYCIQKIIEGNLFKSILNLAKAPSLELGCGNGHVSFIFFDDGGIDVGSDLMITDVLQTKENTKVHKSYMAIDMLRIPFKDLSFSTVFAVHSIDHVLDRNQAIEEISRIIKPGGFFIFSDISEFFWEFSVFSTILRKLGRESTAKELINYRKNAAWCFEDPKDIQSYIKKLNECGFDIEFWSYFVSPKLAYLLELFRESYSTIVSTKFQEILKRYSRIKSFFYNNVEEFFSYFVEADEELCKNEGKGAHLFVCAKKRGKVASSEMDFDRSYVEEILICPNCKGEVKRANGSILCSRCGLEYPVIDDIYLMVPEYADEYKNIMKHRKDEIELLEMYRIGSSLEKDNKLSEAKEVFENLLSRFSSDAQKELRYGVYFHLGRIEYFLGSYDVSHKMLEKCLQLCPSHREAKSIYRKVKRGYR